MPTIEITKKQNTLVRALIVDHCGAYKNWIASAVESGDLPRASELVKTLREYEAMYHVFVPECMFK